MENVIVKRTNGRVQKPPVVTSIPGVPVTVKRKPFYQSEDEQTLVTACSWFGAFFEWMATYLMLWPDDGRMKKEDIRRIYDGSIFYVIAKRRSGKK
ncbi:hypothetical protein F5Y15DRAFT_412347 [Xylariaceae sp. FL0016]|nr:hypothetical protein F5Y15DRAFT_412347 [Xylariaceae sp. FL0016]